jgi:hypothetical protein
LFIVAISIAAAGSDARGQSEEGNSAEPDKSAVDPSETPDTPAEPAFPSYALTRLSATGRAADGHVELNVELRAHLTGESAVAIPLRMEECVLLDEPRFTGGGEQLMSVDAESGGLIWWVRGASENCQLQFRCRVKLADVDGETVLKLTAPTATNSELSIIAPGELAMGVVLRADAEEPVMEDGATRFTLRGLNGGVTFSWKPKGRTIVRGSADLGASLLLKCQFDDLRRLISTTAAIKVRSLNETATFTGFSLRLPAGAVLESTSPPDAQVQTIGAGAAARDVVTFHHAPAASFTAEVRYHQMADGGDESTMLSGLEVSGARQWGHIVLKSPADWRLAVAPLDRRYVQRASVQDAGATLAAEGYGAAFELFSAQASLAVRFYRPEARIAAEGEYAFTVGKDDVVFDARIRYQSAAADASARIDLRDWRGWHVIDAFVEGDPPQPLDVQANQIEATLHKDGATVVRLHALRPLAAGTDSLSLSLPGLEPAAQRARVWVQPRDNLSLQPQEGASPGWLRLPGIGPPPAELLPGAWIRPAFSYSVEANTLRPLLTNIQVHPREVEISHRVEISLTPPASVIRQTLDLAIRHEPLSELAFRAPAEAWERRGFQVSVGGVELQPVWDGPAQSGTTRPGRVVLPAPLGPGSAEVVFRWEIPQAPIEPGQEQLEELSFVTSGAGEDRGCRISIQRPAWLLATVTDETWQKEEVAAASGGGPAGERFIAPKGATGVRLRLERETGEAQGAVQIEKAWIQTWLFGDQRRDRVLFRFASSGGRLGLQLPRGAQWDQVRFNGLSVTLESSSQGQYFLRIPDAPRPQSCLLDLQYHLQSSSTGRAQDLEFARLVGDSWIQHGWLQVVVPGQRHVLWSPAELTSENSWVWRGLWWARQPRRSTAELNAWMDAAGVEPPPGAHEYQYSFFGNTPHVELPVADRAWLVGLASAAALGLGLLLTYLPAFRDRRLLWIVAGCVAALAVVFPEPALVLAQSAALGIVLVAAALLLRRWLELRPQVSSGRTGGSSIRYELGSTQPGQPLAGQPLAGQPLAVSKLRVSTLTAAAAERHVEKE